MRMFSLPVMALKYLNLHKKRYLFLMIAISFGFGIITTLTSIKEGMEQNLYFTAQSHYAGDIVIVGEDRDVLTGFRISDPDAIIAMIEQLDLPISNIVKRTQLGYGTLYFNGTAIRQKYIMGVDWETEVDFFESLQYYDISETPYSPDAIMISRPVAEALNAQVGDKLVFETKTKSGQLNTGSFLVSAIVEDSSIFGYYKVYLSRTELNKMIQYSENQSSTIGMYFKTGKSVESFSKILHMALSENMSLFPLLNDRDELNRERNVYWIGVKYNILTLSVFLSEVAELLLAIELVSYFLYVLMILIIIVSVLVTYRLILHEREKEIGTMRAIAFTQAEIISLLILESVFLLIISLFTGFFISRFVTWGISYLPLNWMPSIEIFMKNGRLTPLYTVRTNLINVAIVLFSLLPAVIWPVYNTSKQPLAVVLSGGNK